jgi:hypothetical protein
MISNDQRSPKISSERLTGHPERRFDFALPGTNETVAKLTCRLQVIMGQKTLVRDEALRVCCEAALCCAERSICPKQGADIQGSYFNPKVKLSPELVP